MSLDDVPSKKAAIEYLVKCRTQYDKQFIQIKTVELQSITFAEKMLE